YAGKYASAIALANGADFLRPSLEAAVGPNVMLWLLACAGALLMWWEPRLAANHRFLIVAFSLCSLTALSLGFYFRRHYVILFLPSLALLAGIAVSRGLQLLKHPQSIQSFFAVLILGLVLVAFLASVVGNGAVWFRLSPAEAARDIYGRTLFSETINAADYIRSRTAKDAR